MDQVEIRKSWVGDNIDELDCSGLTKIKMKSKYEHMWSMK